MARIHILTGAHNLYTIVVHTPTPAGNNEAGVPWATAVQNSGRNQTIMQTGTGPGQITSAEASAIANGTVLEAVFQWGDHRGWTNAQRIADIDLRAQQLTDELLARLAGELRFFGFSRG